MSLFSAGQWDVRPFGENAPVRYQQASPFGDKRQLVRGNPLKPLTERKDVTYA